MSLECHKNKHIKKNFAIFFLIIFLSIKSQISFSKDICSTVSECMKNGYKLIKEEDKIIDDYVIKIFQLKKANTIVLCSTPVDYGKTNCKII